jgi:hypothetical protein
MIVSRFLSLVTSAGHDVEKYYLALSALTPKDGLTQISVAGPSGVQQADSTTVVALFGPVVISFAIFISVLGVFLIGRIRNWRVGVTAFLLAMTLASTPFVLSGLKNGIDERVSASPDEIPRNVRIIPISKTSVQIIWDTDAAKVGAVRIGALPYSTEKTRIIVGNSGDKTKVHAVSIFTLTYGQIYECEVLSGTRWYDNGGNRLRFQMDK